jgi:hypothetical protein
MEPTFYRRKTKNRNSNKYEVFIIAVLRRRFTKGYGAETSVLL